MRKLTIILTLLVAIPAFSYSQMGWKKGIKGNGNLTTENRSISNFDEIKVATGVQVYFTQDSDFDVKVETDENLQDLIQTTVKNGKLTVRIKQNTSIKKSSKLAIHVTAPDLEVVECSSGSGFKTTDEVSGNDLIIKVSSGANVKADLNYERLKCSTSSGSHANLNGSADMAEMDSSSGSMIKAKELTVGKCKASASSGSNISLKVTSQLDGKASSGGAVRYSGNPAKVDKSQSSGGSVSGS